MNSNESFELPDAKGLGRRDFLRLSGTLAAAGALASAGCQVPQEATVPFHDMPENLVDGLGHARFFHTVIDGTPVLVRTREGRPILVAPSPTDTSGRGLSLRHQAALMDLYDPDRASGPLSVRRGKGAVVTSSWNAIGADVVAKIKAAGPKAVLLTGPVNSPALAAAVAALTAKTGMRHVTWAPLAGDAVAAAWKQAFGHSQVARPNIEKADLLIGLGAEFLDRPDDGLEKDFSMRRAPDGNGAKMSRFIQLEGRLTLTGANADKRLRVRDSQLARVGAALAHELIVVRKTGPLATNADVASALAPFAIDTVAAQAGVDPAALKALAGEIAAAPGKALVLAGGSASTSASGVAIEVVALLLNLTTGAFDGGLFDETAAVEPVTGRVPALAALAGEMAAGGVEVLLVAGANPVYNAPASVKFADALAKVPFIVSLNDRIDETSQKADYLAPCSHSLECWSDATLPKGLLAVQQPVIQPLFDTRGLLDVLVDWAAAVGDTAAIAAVTKATTKAAPVPATAELPSSTSLAYHYMRAAWVARLGGEPGLSTFEKPWNEVLRAGFWQGPVPAAAPHAFNPAALTALAAAGVNAKADGLELQLYPHLALLDGRSGNNGWLQEFPDPITRIAWGAALSIAPRRFDEMKLANGDLVEVDAGHAKLVVPAYRHAGMHHDQVALALGHGRTACGVIGVEVGHNAFTLGQVAGDRTLAAGLPVTIKAVGGNETLAMGQGSDILDRDQRPLVPATVLTAFEKEPKAGTEQQEGGPSAWPEHEYPGAKWEMAIDLSKCNGCGKCVIGCQAENNIPVVGRQTLIDGRPMAWIRIDRYYDAPKKDGGWDAEVWDGPLAAVEEPQTLFEPMLCQHCGNAPCETVCPFVATMHSEDGLNQQIYNRCVGTRYCANNCPFKVRRYNFWEYGQARESAFFRWLEPRIEQHGNLNTRAPIQMKNNPEVTVRSRGVMEKCSFCVQRIRAATAQATRDGQSKTHLPDGSVVPACAECCPTGAITFGDANAPGSKVSAQASSPRAMRLLEAVGVKPSISYLTKVRNDKA